jgi:hypothetical protein
MKPQDQAWGNQVRIFPSRILEPHPEIGESKESLLLEYIPMLAKLTSKNQLTLPTSVTSAVGATEYFEVQVKGGQIILTPVRIQRGDSVRAKLEELDITGDDIADAVSWARQPKRRSK